MRYCSSAVAFSQIQPYPATGVVSTISGGRRRGEGIRFPPRSGSGILGSSGFTETKEPIEDEDHQHSTPTVGRREDVGRKAETSSEEGGDGLSAETEGIPPDKDAATIRDKECPPDTLSISSSSISSKSDSSPSSLYSTPATQCNGGSPVLTPATPASSSPPTRIRNSATATLPHGARRTGILPCKLVQSHPLTTYRLREICPNCRNARVRQDGRLELLKEGLKQLRIIVEGMVAVEDMQQRDRQAHIEDEADAIPAELKESGLNEKASEGDEPDEEVEPGARSRCGMLKGG